MKHLLALLLITLPLLMGWSNPKPKPPVPTPLPVSGGLAALSVPQSPHLGIAYPPINNYSALTHIGVSHARIDVRLSAVRPSSTTYSFGGLDAKIDSLLALDITPWLTLVSDAPAWMGWTQTAAQNESPSSPTQLADWIDFAAAVAERYDNDGLSDHRLPRSVDHIILLNEWPTHTNPAGGWAGSWASLPAFIDATVKAILWQSPTAIITLGGPALGAMDIAMVALGAADWTVTVDGPVTFTPAQIRANKSFVSQADSVSWVYKHLPADLNLSIHQYGPKSHFIARQAFLDSLTNYQFDFVSDEAGGPSLLYTTPITPMQHFSHAVELNLFNLSQGMTPTLWFHFAKTGNESSGNLEMPLVNKDGTKRGGWYGYKVLALVLEGMTSVQWLDDGVYLIEATDHDTYVCLPGAIYQLPADFLAQQMITVTDFSTGAYTLSTPTFTINCPAQCVIVSSATLIK